MEMTEPRSPWARPPADSVDPAGDPTHPSSSQVIVAPPPQASEPTQASRPTRASGSTLSRQRAGYRAGAVTRLAPAAPKIPPPEAPPEDPGRRNKRTLLLCGGIALGVIVTGLVITLAIVLTGGSDPFGRRARGPSDTRPDLAKLCPPPAHDAGGGAPVPAPPGPRTVDTDSGISYEAFGPPWQPWHDSWTKGTLHVSYRTGQFFVTESYIDQYGYRGNYLASILSGSVPAANNDSLSLDLECTGRQVAADVRAEYYPRPNQMDLIRDEQTTLGGRPAWITKFRMHFHQTGLKATDELVGLALVDVGRPRAAILYVSIPGTHHDYDYVVDKVLDSVRPVS
jgi:hypothetical protein